MSDSTDPVTETAKAVQEASKFGVEAVKAGRAVGGYVGEIVREIFVQGAGIYSDRLMQYRAEKWLEAQARFERRAKAIGFTGPYRHIPMAVKLPLIEAITLEEDDSLRDRWVNLLLNFANGASGVQIEKTFVRILAELSPLDARVMDAIYEVKVPPNADDWSIRTEHLPERAEMAEDPSAPKEERRPGKAPTPDVEISLDNLRRHALIDSAMAWGGPTLLFVHQTPLGAAFVRACRTSSETGEPQHK